MNDNALSRIAQLAASNGEPHAGLLDPEVRSGCSFTFSPGGVTPTSWPRFQLVWFYTVDLAKRADFATKIALYESSATMTGAATYRGTYSVTISGAVPELEYRTYWGLDTLAAIQDLNNALNAATTGPLHEWLALISLEKGMRSELMGRTVGSAKLTG